MWTAASLPPVIMTSAMSVWIMRKASPSRCYGSTRRRDRTARALQAESHRNIPARGIHDQLGDHEWRHTAGAAIVERCVLSFDFVQPADPATDNDTAAIRIGMVNQVETGMATAF